MPRRKPSEAEEQAHKAKNARWRYAIRNPNFRSELRTVSDLHDSNREAFKVKFDELLRKWGFHYIRGEILLLLTSFDPLSQEETDFLEAYSDLVLSYPVLARETDQDHILLLEIDLNNPLDLLVAGVEEELRWAVEERQEGPRGRRRLDKADFHLKVYDLAAKGESFGAIAKALKQRDSTVKSRFLVARRNIFGSVVGPSKRDLPLADFDKDSHVERCTICKAAQRFEDMCPQARLYAIDDHVSQRELATEHIERIRVGGKRRRKQPL